MEGLLFAEGMWKSDHTISSIHNCTESHMVHFGVSFINAVGSEITFRVSKEYAMGVNEYTYHYFRACKLK
jgi:hypothetical protein